MKNSFLHPLVALTLSLGALANEKEPVALDVQATEQWLVEHPKAVILDVRTKEEHAEGAIKGNVLIPYTDKDFAERIKKELKPDQPILVYCRSGGRSSQAVKALQDAGCKDVKELKGGVIAWEKAGKTLVK